MIFNESKVIGFFNGLSESGLEFGAEITIRYDTAQQNIPMLGQFVLIELSRNDEAVLGRITTVRSAGKLAGAPGDDLGLKTIEHQTPMSEDIKNQFLRYKVSLRLLGILRETRTGNDSKINITPSNRRLPHLGSKVAFLDDSVLRKVAGADRDGSEIGYLAFGEFVYSLGDSNASTIGDQFVQLAPVVTPQFKVTDLVRRRTQIFARAGFGKSNLIKLLFAQLYKEETPKVTLDDGSEKPVGSLIFDPDGEYFWPGPQVDSPPGLCDIPALKNKIALFTDRKSDNDYYNSFILGSTKVDIRTLRPNEAVSVLLTLDRQGQQGTKTISRLREGQWRDLVDRFWLFSNTRNYQLINDEAIQEIANLDGNNANAQVNGLRNSMLEIVELHDPRSATLERVLGALEKGMLVIFDLSRMRGRPATCINALFLQQIFNRNLKSHTGGDLLPCISIIEEAQKVLSGDAHPVFVEWTKEGRKYGLGSVIVTQQPGVIDMEILSQSDTTFAFHVVSKSDLNALQNANAHFSNDILSCLLNEPIEGQGYFWTSASKPKLTYPISFRAFDFGVVYTKIVDASTLSNDQVSRVIDEIIEQDDSHPLPNDEEFEDTAEEMYEKEYRSPNDASERLAQRLEQLVRDRGFFPLPDNGKVLFGILEDLKKIPEINSSQKNTFKMRVWAIIHQFHGQKDDGFRVDVHTSQSGNRLLKIIPTERGENQPEEEPPANNQDELRI